VERVVSCSAKQSERGGWLWHTQNLGWITHATTPTLPYPTLPSIFHPLADREGFTDCIPPPPWFGLATPSTSPGFLLFPPPHSHVDGRYSTYQQLLGVVESQVDSIRSNAPHPFSVVTPPIVNGLGGKGGEDGKWLYCTVVLRAVYPAALMWNTAAPRCTVPTAQLHFPPGPLQFLSLMYVFHATSRINPIHATCPTNF
jgi:hypothetical protein